jgi:hypothetical protein
MSRDDYDTRLVELIAELRRCRRRGIDQLDLDTHNQRPIAALELERLAADYAISRGMERRGRTPEIKLLLRDGLAAWEDENPRSATLIRDLFFGDSTGTVTKRAGDLLKAAKHKWRVNDDRGFHAMCDAALHDFAEFLIDWADASRADSDAVDPDSITRRPEPTRLDKADPEDTDVEHQQITTGYIRDRDRFVQLLAEAANVTIIGVTHEHLAVWLESALALKRAATHRPDAFWNSLHIVFLSEKLLEHINDERPTAPDRMEALRQRRLGASYGRRSVRAFLHHAPAARWELYETSYVPPLFGSLFEMPDGSHVIHMMIRDPQRNPRDQLYLELADTTHRYFGTVFEAVVRSGVEGGIVPVGTPHGDRFSWSAKRFRHSVLKDGSGATGWLPVVLVVTWRSREGQAEPLFQLRVPGLAVRELDRLSHPASYLYQDDLLRSPGNPVLTAGEFGLDDVYPANAARRRLRWDTGVEPLGEIHPVTTGRQLHSDKEHLFFFLFSYEFPADFPLPRSAEMHAVPFRDLLAIRQNQTLRQAALLCQSTPTPPKVRAGAYEIAALNLMLDGQIELGRRLVSLLGKRDPQLRDVVEELTVAEQHTRQLTWTSTDREVTLKGLSCLQYREFYRVLLPLYAKVGVPGAADHLSRLHGNEEHRSAVARLSELYQDDELMSRIPVEL